MRNFERIAFALFSSSCVKNVQMHFNAFVTISGNEQAGSVTRC